MPSIATALVNAAKKTNNNIAHAVTSMTGANAMGDSLQKYFESLFIENIELLTPEELSIQTSQVFSWTGNQNNPPDLILRGGDAIEVKKVNGTGSLALNSSYPKQQISSNDPMITTDCRKCEGIGTEWTKDFWYVIGTIGANKIKYLFVVQGSLYSAEESTYARIKEKIKFGVQEIPDVEFTSTKELGKVKRVDPLGITDLRIRGMWSILHPFSVYSYIPEIMKHADENKMVVYAIMQQNKYDNFEQSEIETLESLQNVSVYSKQIKNPNNPAELLHSKLVKIEV